MTKEELIQAMEDDEFANEFAHALLGRCNLVCNARNSIRGRTEYVDIQIKAPDGKVILSDTIYME